MSRVQAEAPDLNHAGRIRIYMYFLHRLKYDYLLIYYLHYHQVIAKITSHCFDIFKYCKVFNVIGLVKYYYTYSLSIYMPRPIVSFT